MTARPTILVVDDDAAFRGVLQSELQRMEFEVSSAASGEAAIDRVANRAPDVVLLDLRLPGANGLDVLKAIRARAPATEVIMLTGHGSIDTAIESVRMGAFDYVPKPCPLDDLEVRIRRALERQSLRTRANLLERGLTPPDLGSEFVGESPAFKDLLALVDRAGPSDATVLILGETGSGKEMVAKLLHARSGRRKRPFVTVECAALQESLLQSELFGHERGAFTGADRAKPGLFEVAHGGTLFLDEIGEVSPATQVKLLRVLDAGTFRRVGGTTEIRVDVRIIAATNRALPAMVSQGLFREDLFYRLSTLRMQVPPLRERGDDVDVLAAHFVALYSERFGVRRRIGAEALAALRNHDWPGNVRELLHAIEAAMIVCDGSEILARHLPPALRGEKDVEPVPEGLSTLRQMERTHIARALSISDGHRAHAARILGISERNLYRKLRVYGIDA
ncbi:MAG TPA: sigma-54 dependent transcriptional regulator [Vicinamibacterales bacterium]|nr:sigma-54 dependent transcriptional regulator [Vicinamibacterales bacterium]